MQAISNALSALLEEGAWFARATDLKLLAVRVSGDLRKAALQILAGLECHHDNRSAWIALPDAHLRGDDGWPVRANRLLGSWEERRRGFREKAGVELPAPLLGDEQDFAGAARAVSGALAAPLEGLVFIVAPTVLEDAEALGAELEAMIVDRRLARCRWVWVLDEHVEWPSLIERLGRFVLRCDCIPDPAQRHADLRALVDSSGGSFGEAGPRGVTPPQRPEDRRSEAASALRDAALRDAGIDPAYLTQAPLLRRLLFGAALAMKDGQGPEAVRMQREACALAVTLSLFDVAVICRTTLACYLSGLGLRERAVAELRAAVALAGEHTLLVQQAQAHLALALLLALDRQVPEAVNEYIACARVAERAEAPLLAIEAWRLAGQLALPISAEEQAVACFLEALRIAGAADGGVRQASSAAEVARQLATVCEGRGLRAQAESLFQQAQALESAPPGAT